jgi:hypothetical protein
MYGRRGSGSFIFLPETQAFRSALPAKPDIYILIVCGTNMKSNISINFVFTIDEIMVVSLHVWQGTFFLKRGII